jgi:hypothetical protein
MSVILEFIGQTDGAQAFRHPVTKRSIRAGRHLAVRYVHVEQEEVDYLISLGLFRVAHSSQKIVVPARKDAPVRIEPIADTTPSVSATEEPKENVVSFEENQVEQLVDWLSNETTVEVEVETPTEAIEELDNNVRISEEQKFEKVRRGRPRS